MWIGGCPYRGLAHRTCVPGWPLFPPVSPHPNPLPRGEEGMDLARAPLDKMVEEIGVGYANGDILLGVSWRLIRFHARGVRFRGWKPVR